VVQLATEFENGRTRRLAPGEEARLMQHAGDHLRALIVAALETGCRVGELLNLRWSDVLWTDEPQPKMRKFVLSADRTKTARTRTIPITSRLRAVMEMRRTDPKGENLPPTAYVFGNAVGEPVKRVVRAWQATCRRAGIVDLHFHDLRANSPAACWSRARRWWTCRPHWGTPTSDDAAVSRRHGCRLAARVRSVRHRAAVDGRTCHRQ
jgi:integrase